MQSAVSVADARPRVTFVVKPGTEDRVFFKHIFIQVLYLHSQKYNASWEISTINKLMLLKRYWH